MFATYLLSKVFMKIVDKTICHVRKQQQCLLFIRRILDI